MSQTRVLSVDCEEVGLQVYLYCGARLRTVSKDRQNEFRFFEKGK